MSPLQIAIAGAAPIVAFLLAAAIVGEFRAWRSRCRERDRLAQHIGDVMRRNGVRNWRVQR